MVSRAGKDFLKNTIRTVDHHNRILEEEFMWSTREQEKSKPEKHSRSHKKRKGIIRDVSPEEIWKEGPKKQKVMIKEDNKKWDHNGFLELYPDYAAKPDVPKPKETQKKKKKKKDKKRKYRAASPSSEDEIWVEKKIS